MANGRNKALAALAREAYRRTGLCLDEGRHSLIERRLRKRCRALGLDGVEAYWDLLKRLDDRAEEVAEFLQAVTTHKTYFFRTPGVWDFLAEELGRLAESRGRARIWSAACSYGHEPCSLALLAESIRERSPGFDWRLLATDVSPKSVARTARFTFDEDELEEAAQARPDVPVRRRFDRSTSGQRQLAPELRARAECRPHSIFDPIGRTFDIALARNVIIYFDEADKERAIRSVTDSLVPGGLLVIGESESLTDHTEDMEYLGPCLYRKPS